MNAIVRPHSSRLAVPAVLLLLAVGACGLFEPREAEQPTESGLNFVPPTDPGIVISNLQAAIDQKNAANYIACFSDVARQGRPFVFIPSAEAIAQYAAVLADWDLAKEEAYFQNLIARSPTTAFSSLVLTLQSSIVSADSVLYEFDYIFSFGHNEQGFPQTARGRLQFTLGVDASTFWSIHRWIDFKSTEDATWSLFKGKFGN
jgi:hypothetical protein